MLAAFLFSLVIVAADVASALAGRVWGGAVLLLLDGRRSRGDTLLAALAVPIAGYALSPFPPVWLARSTADRFLVLLALPATVLLAMAAREALSRRAGRVTTYAGRRLCF